MSKTDESRGRSGLPARICHRAVEARDPRFDGVFFVGISTTRIYCRPICPSRAANRSNRRFFESAAEAEQSGFRPCLRCRPELAPGKAPVDAVQRLASDAAERIAAGALNARPLKSLASELHVSERHLRRALRQEMGVTPVQLAQTYRLLMAKRLLADTTLDMSRVAFASGFRSLRRFNAVVRESYGMAPSALRQRSRRGRPGMRENDPASDPTQNALHLTLAYRAPFAWGAMLEFLAQRATPGVEVVEGQRYGRLICVEGRVGIVFMEDAPSRRQVRIEVSAPLVPVLIPLLAVLRRLLDLDAEPRVIDACLSRAGLRAQTEACPGLRVPGGVDGFEVAFLALVRGSARPARRSKLAGEVVRALGDPVAVGHPAVDRLPPGPERVAEAGEAELAALGIQGRRARAIVGLARAVADGSVRLAPEGNPAEVHAALAAIPGIDSSQATRIVMRALSWPDAFPAADRTLQRATGAAGMRQLFARAEAWRPWRSYAAMHLWRSGRLPID